MYRKCAIVRRQPPARAARKRQLLLAARRQTLPLPLLTGPAGRLASRAAHIDTEYAVTHEAAAAPAANEQ